MSETHPYYRLVLTERQSRWLWGPNPDLVRWKTLQYDDLASDAARAAGYDAWLVFDSNERLVGQGAFFDPGD